MEQNKALENEVVDVTAQFMSMDPMEFGDLVRRLKRGGKKMKIEADFTNLDNATFAAKARALKAFLETYGNMAESASIKCTKEQKRLEYNVFSSGVEWVDANA